MRRTVIFGLTAILVAYLALVHRQSSPLWFGYYHDDSLYWTAAQSLASGDGYRMASVPGEPPQTKYPVFFPWVLSWVWSLSPEFPANLSVAIGAVALGGVVFLGGCFALLRQLGLGDPTALMLTAVCALHPVVIHLGGLLLSDVPFMAVAVWSMVLAGSALDRQQTRHGVWLWGAALVLAVLACQLRSIGVSLLGGFVLAALWRRCYRPAAGCLALAVVVALATVPLGSLSLDARAAGSPEAAGTHSGAVEAGGYEQTMQFYGSYLDFWKLSTPDWPTFSALLSFNFREMLKQPAIAVFEVPASGFAGFGWQLGAVALSFTVLKGMGSLALAARHPAFAVLGVYAAVVLVWNYTLMDRLLAWALPLFLAGAWFEIRRLAATTRDTFRRGAPRSERAVAVVVMALLAATSLYGGYRYLWAAPAAMASELAARQRLQAEKQQAYQWIRRNTSPEDRFVASEDASLYLFTGRQALRPMAFSTAAFYLQSEPLLERDLERMTDAPRAIGARYWLAAADDYHLESAEQFIKNYTRELLEELPEVFVSSERNVIVYDISPWSNAAAPPQAAPATGQITGRGRTSVSRGIGL
jgi:hypothetical protein